jgi:hypothetical protein
VPARDRVRWPLWLALLPIVLLPLVLTGSVLAAPRASGTPVATVRGFLTAAVVNDDGESACAYLTAQARVDFEGHGLSSADDTCQRFFGGAVLTLGGEQIASHSQVDGLNCTVAPAAGDRLVTCSHRGQSIRFVLRPANSFETQSFRAPDTPWRITSSVRFLGAL